MPTLLSFARPIARKEHRCGLCYGTINKGEKYVRETCVDDDAPYTVKAHDYCFDAITALHMKCDYDGVTSDIFEEYITDYASDNDIDPDKFDTFHDLVVEVMRHYDETSKSNSKQ